VEFASAYYGSDRVDGRAQTVRASAVLPGRFSGVSGKNPRVPAEFGDERDGEVVEFSKYISKLNLKVNTIVVERLDFPVCPICLERDPSHEEHVPPESIGGKVMTLTCQRCNNDFGTAEEQWRSLFDLEMTVHVESTDGSVPGRRPGKVVFRSSPGRPNEFFVRSAAPGFEEIRTSGAARAIPKPLDMVQVTAAALKHSYLAVCLHNREIPEGREAELARAILRAARDRDADALVAGLTEFDFKFPMGWIETPSDCPPVLLREVESEGTTTWEFLMGGNVRLQWPLRTVAPLAARYPRPATTADDK
jgi:hypothetical protein